jgi:hypothetical protein
VIDVSSELVFLRSGVEFLRVNERLSGLTLVVVLYDLIFFPELLTERTDGFALKVRLMDSYGLILVLLANEVSFAVKVDQRDELAFDITEFDVLTLDPGDGGSVSRLTISGSDSVPESGLARDNSASIIQA